MWFQAALAAGPGSPERARYMFREGSGPDGSLPPNNWESVFGGPAWTRVEDGQWYLHLFDSTQPDLDWRNPEVGDMFEDVLRFWLDKGVDGFRVDVAHGLYKEESLRDQVVEAGERPDLRAGQLRLLDGLPRAQGRADVGPARGARRLPPLDDVLDSVGADRMAVAEAWTQTPESMAAFVRPDELDQAFNFAWLLAEWSAESFREVVADTLAAVAPVGASPTWVLSNHDVVRHPTRYGGGEQGLARARAATLAMLALPGSSYLYQGEELGLEQVDVAPEDRQDPSWFRTGEVGRDGCRVPIPWSGDSAPFGFGPGDAQPWIPQPDEFKGLTVEAQTGVEGSTLEFYRAALAARREHALPAGDEVTLVEATGDVLELHRGDLRVLLNCGTTDVPLPDGPGPGEQRAGGRRAAARHLRLAVLTRPTSHRRRTARPSGRAVLRASGPSGAAVSAGRASRCSARSG